MASYTNIGGLKCKYRMIKDKLKKAFESICECIAMRLMSSDLDGEDVIAITKSQFGRLVKAYEANKGMAIKLSRRQLAYNMKIEGRFLPMLAGLTPFLPGTVLPALGVGALSGLASTGVQKLIGNGLYLKKGVRMFQIETDGSGLYLGPTSGN